MLRVNEDAFKKRKKFNLCKGISIGLIVSGLLCMSSSACFLKNLKHDIPYTESDYIYREIFSNDYKEVLESTPLFTNPELESIILEQNLPFDQITELRINTKLENNDLSDLKYLTNLERLIIYNNDIDVSDIQYNQKLVYLDVLGCHLSNTQYLPNSIMLLSGYGSYFLGDQLSVPYSCFSIHLNDCYFNNLFIKNPERLDKVEIKTLNVFDCNCFKDCKSLEKLVITGSPNVLNPEVLKGIKIDEMEVDDYASIWLDKDLYKRLGINNKVVAKEIDDIDTIYRSIITEDMSDEEKIRQISIYILRRYTYNLEIYELFSDGNEHNNEDVHDYNNNPISTGLYRDSQICVNYAALFSALVNRCGIKNFEVNSDSHAWNMYELDNKYWYTDLTTLDDNPCNKVTILDNGEPRYYVYSDTTSLEMLENGMSDKLCFYKFSEDDEVFKIYDEIKYYPVFLDSLCKDIGYIEDEKAETLLDANMDNLSLAQLFNGVGDVFLVSGIGLSIFDFFRAKQKRNKKELKY